MNRVNVRMPALYLAVAVLLALGTLLLPGRQPAGGTGAPPPAPATTAPAVPCTGVRDSLRPQGPLPAPGQPPAGSTTAAIVARGFLVAGVDQGKYLVGYRDPQTGELAGADIDLVHLIAAAILGDPAKVRFVVLDIADRVPAIQQGRVDLVVNNFTVTCERQRAVEFSTGYQSAAERVLVPAGSAVHEIEDLAGRRVCTSRGSTNEGDLAARQLRLDVVALAGIPDCVVALQQGRVDAVVSDDVILAGLAAQDPQTVVVGRPLTDVEYAVGIRPDRPDLVRFVNGVLERGRADGSLAAIDRHWLNRLDPLPAVPPARYRD